MSAKQPLSPPMSDQSPRITRRIVPAIDQPADLSAMSLADVARAVAERRLPPVEQWQPDHCGDSEMRIDRAGQWHHQGSPIGRAALWKLFATLLRREADGSYALVTPVERLSIAVEDAAFIAVELISEGHGPARRLAFRLNSDDLVIAGPDHPLSIVTSDDGPRPYLAVRGGLTARLSRAVYYELVGLALAECEAADGDSSAIGLWSDGAFFALGGLESAEAPR